jgi:hypothetical protein
MELEFIMMDEIKPSSKEKYHTFLFICRIQTKKKYDCKRGTIWKKTRRKQERKE